MRVNVFFNVLTNIFLFYRILFVEIAKIMIILKSSECMPFHVRIFDNIRWL